MRGLVDELLELSDPEVDQRIIKSFKMKDTLCPSIFNKIENGSYVIKKEIRDQLITISDEFVSFWGVDFFIHDIILTGSLANYNWSEYSDVDLHIMVDMSELGDSEALTKIVKEFFDAKKNVWNEKHDIKIKNFEVGQYTMIRLIKHETLFHF
jgi:hypothetical protein